MLMFSVFVATVYLTLISSKGLTLSHSLSINSPISSTSPMILSTKQAPVYGAIRRRGHYLDGTKVPLHRLYRNT